MWKPLLKKMAACKCGSKWGHIEPKPVNTAAVIEDIYGDVNNLTEEQLDEIDWSLEQLAIADEQEEEMME